MIKAMIFAAGLGSRLRPITDTIPKALVEVGGVPMLRRVIDRVIAAGAGQIVVNVHHFASKIADYLDSVAGELDAEIIIADESSELLETGGGLIAAESRLMDADAIILHNADILSDASLDLLLAMHDYRKATATLMVDPQRESSRRLLFDSDLRLCGRINLAKDIVTPAGLDTDGLERAAFSGIHVVSPDIFAPLRDYSVRVGKSAFSITDFYAEEAARLPIYGYVAERPSLWLDIGRPESLAEARKMFDKEV